MGKDSLLILMYHMISEPGSGEDGRYTCPPLRFERHMRFLRKKRFNIISMEQVLCFYKEGIALPERPVAITMDDGFGDNYIHAFPILKKYDIPATIFLVAGQIGKTNEWMDVGNYQSRIMLNWEQVRQMGKWGVSFGAHTMTHVRLPDLPAKDAADEIRRSKEVIEGETGRPVSLFAYPYGLYSEESIRILKQCGFQLSCSTRSGFNNRETDPFLLRRIEVYGDDPVWKLSQKLTFGMNDASLLFPLKYYSSRIRERFL